MKSIVYIPVIIIYLLLTGCSDPKDWTVPTDISTWKTNETFKEVVQKLPEEDKELLAKFAIRAAISSAFSGKGITEGTTIRDAIKSQKQWQEEQLKEKHRQQLLAKELKAKQLSALKEMNQALTATLLSLNYHPSNWKDKQYSDVFSIVIGFKNNTKDNLSGAKGTVVLKDMFGEAIKQINVSNDSSIPANKTVTYSGTFNYNPFIQQDKKLKNTAFDKLQFEWIPDTYIFENGQKLLMPKT